MKLKVLVFGMAKDVVGGDVVEIEVGQPCDVAELKKLLKDKSPRLPDFMIAINANYALEDQIIRPRDEIALIPPTNGG